MQNVHFLSIGDSKSMHFKHFPAEPDFSNDFISNNGTVQSKLIFVSYETVIYSDEGTSIYLQGA